MTFTVQPGLVTGFVGPNGAGKSTTMRMIVGLDLPTQGSVLVNGRRYPDWPAPIYVALPPDRPELGRRGRPGLHHRRPDGVTGRRPRQVTGKGRFEARECVITPILADGFQLNCVRTVSLPDGTIAFQGLATDKPLKPLAILGGTEKYRSAHGTLTVLEHGDETGTITVRSREVVRRTFRSGLRN